MPHTRRAVVVGAVAGAALLPLQRAAAAAPIAIVDTFGPGSLPHRALTAVVGPMGKALARPVTIQVSSEGPYAAGDKVIAGPADGSLLMVMEGLGLVMAERFDPKYRGKTLLAPVGKLTAGYSVALAVSRKGPLGDFAAFARAAKAGRIRVASYGRLAGAPAVALAMLKRELKADFADVICHDRAEIVAALMDGRADACMLATGTLMGRQESPLRPLCSFGGGRHPAFPDTPTFRELTQPKNTAFTSAFGVFGPTAMDPATVTRLSEALVGSAREAAGPARRLGVALDIGGPEVMVAAMERNMRILASVLPWMKPGT